MGFLEIQDLRLQLGGKQVLNGMSLDLWEGHVHAIIGPNGAGKSTLASTIMGLEGYTEFQGDILLDGQSIKRMPLDERARRGITLAWQEPARFEGVSVHDFILAGTAGKDGKRVSEALNKVGLDPDKYAERAVDTTLSGGERKRVELASILAMEPRLVLMDEPDSGIDVEALNRIFDVLKTLRGRGTTVVMITHSLTVLRQAEHAFLMCCGKLIDKGDVEKIAYYFENQCIPCEHKNEPEEEKQA